MASPRFYEVIYNFAIRNFSESPPFKATRLFLTEIRGFPSPSHDGFGFMIL